MCNSLLINFIAALFIPFHALVWRAKRERQYQGKRKNNCIVLALEVLYLRFPWHMLCLHFPNGWTFLHSPATADYCSNCEETPSAERALNPGDAKSEAVERKTSIL